MGYLLLCLKIQNGESNMAAKTAFLSHFKEFERLYSNKLGKWYIYYFYGCLSIAVCVIYLKVQNGESNMAAKTGFNKDFLTVSYLYFIFTIIIVAKKIRRVSNLI